MTPEHQVRRNESFQGLRGPDATELSNYLHFRNVQDGAKKADLDLPTAPFNPHFLEAVTEDKPKGCWNIVQCEKQATVVIRSLMWPGYQFYH
jgi:radial spoke head protein 9